MTARSSIILWLIVLSGLVGTLAWVRTPDASRTIAAPQGTVAGLSIESVDGVDHLVERHVGPVGYFSLVDQLNAINVELSQEDRYTAVPDPTLGVGSLIEIRRATPVTVVDATVATEYRTWDSTVEQLLTSKVITLDEDDRVDPEFSTPLQQDLTITITRVGVDEETETEEIPFKMITKQDGELEKGKTRVGQRGRVGLKKHTYRVTRENGQEVGRERIKTEIVREPQDKILYEGTKTVSFGSGQATWYDLKSGFGAAHNTLPYGTRVKVTNLSNGKSVDVVINDHGIRGGAIIDLTKEAFAQIAPLGAGRIQVKIEKDYD